MAADGRRTVPAKPGGEAWRDGSGGLRALIPLASVALVLIIALELREIAPLIVPVLFGLFLALIATPLVDRFTRAGASRTVALAGTIGVVLLVVVAASTVIALSVTELALLVPTYEDRLVGAIAEVRDFLASLGFAVDTAALTGLISPGTLASLAQAAAAMASQTAAWLLILGITFIYALSGGAALDRRARAALGDGHSALAMVERFGADLRRFLIVRAQLGLFASALSLLLFVVLGLPLPVLWAFLIFSAAFIPNVGTIVAVLPPALLALLDGGVGVAAALLAGVFLVNLAQDYVLQPRMMGTELNLTSLAVFLSIVVWTWILGPAGALLAVPLTVGLVALLEASPATRPIALLMRNELEAGPAVTA